MCLEVKRVVEGFFKDFKGFKGFLHGFYRGFYLPEFYLTWF